MTGAVTSTADDTAATSAVVAAAPAAAAGVATPMCCNATCHSPECDGFSNANLTTFQRAGKCLTTRSLAKCAADRPSTIDRLTRGAAAKCPTTAGSKCAAAEGCGNSSVGTLRAAAPSPSSTRLTAVVAAAVACASTLSEHRSAARALSGRNRTKATTAAVMSPIRAPRPSAADARRTSAGRSCAVPVTSATPPQAESVAVPSRTIYSRKSAVPEGCIPGFPDKIAAH